MKKKAFTLVEILVSIMITTILLTMSFSLYKPIKTITTESKTNNVLLNVSNIISYGKSYCYSNEFRGILTVNRSLGVITFKNADNLSRTIKSYYLPKGYSFLGDLSLNVSVDGVVASNTINIKEPSGVYRIVTISVGVDYVNIY